MLARLVKVNKEGSKIILILRDENLQKRIVEVIDFRPYFYIPHEKGEYTSIFGEKLHKIYVKDPSDVPNERSKYPKHYEADIPYTRRFMIDVGISDYIQIPEKNKISFSEIIPTNSGNIPLRIWYIDIEVLSDVLPDPKNPLHSVCSISIFDSYLNRYFTITLHNTNKVEILGDWRIAYMRNEEELLQAFMQLYGRANPDVIVGWNVYFDIDYLSARIKKLGYEFTFETSQIFDLLEAFKILYKRPSYKLKTIAIEEGFANTYETFNMNMMPEEMAKYNVNDVKYLVQLDKKYKLLDFYWNLKVYSGVNHIEDTFITSVMVDTALLRLAKILNVILPSKNEVKEKETYEGAIVLEPPKGIYENVAIFDMKRYYPSIIITFNISPETLHEEGDIVYGKFRFRSDKEGIIPALCKYFIKLRDDIDSQLSELNPDNPKYDDLSLKSTAIKYLINTVYGYLGYVGSRLYDVRLAEIVTAIGREGILKTKEIVEKYGYKVIYGDSVSGDSIIHYFTLSGNLRTESIEALFERYKRYAKKRSDGKEEIYLKNFHLLTFAISMSGEVGLKEIVRIIRHSTNKPLYEIVSESGKKIKVTPDHSLIVYDVYSKVFKCITTNELCIDTDRYRLVVLNDEMFNMWKGIQTPTTSCKQNSWNNFQDVYREVQHTTRKEKRNANWFSKELLEQRFNKGATYNETWKGKIHGVAKKTFHIIKRILSYTPRTYNEVKRGWGEDNAETLFIQYVTNRKNSIEYLEAICNKIQFYDSLPEAISEFHGPRHNFRIFRTKTPDIYRWLFLSLLQRVWFLSKIRNTTKNIGTRYIRGDKVENYKYKLYKNLGTRNKERLVWNDTSNIKNNRNDKKWSKDTGSFIRFERIIRIEKTNESNEMVIVYDLEVDDYHTFIANNIFIHNTDSLMIQIPFDKVGELTELLNKDISEYFITKYGVKNCNIKLKSEAYCDKIIFFGVKKRYVAHIIYEKGVKCDKMKIVGLEAIRTDQSNYSRFVQSKLIELILRGASKEEIIQFIKDAIDNIKKQKLIDIAIVKGIDKPLDEYKSMAPHVRGALYSNMYLGTKFQSGDRIYLIWVKNIKGYPKTDVVAFSEDVKLPPLEVDWKRMIEVNILQKVDKILEVIGININDILSPYRRLDKWF